MAASGVLARPMRSGSVSGGANGASFWGVVVVSGSGLPPYGVPIGVAVAALGGWLIHRDRGHGRVPVRPARSGARAGSEG